MTSPFMGMDPYLEQTDWESVHVQFAVEIARTLAPLLAPKYFVRSEKICVWSAVDAVDDVCPIRHKPDVAVMSSGLPGAASCRRHGRP
jgi:hypothetical protein